MTGIPAYVRQPKVRARLRDRHKIDGSSYQIEANLFAVLSSARGQHLHAKAEAKKRLMLGEHLLFYWINQSAIAQRSDPIAECADAGQNNSTGNLKPLRILCKLYLRPKYLADIPYGAHIPHSVVDNSNHALITSLKWRSPLQANDMAHC